MREIENHSYLIGYIISNAFALLLLSFAVIYPRIARVLFFLLFALASWINWKTALQSPNDYVRTSEFALNVYRQFIIGWFSKHVFFVVGFIATTQGLIAISLLLKGWIYRTGIIGAIVFLLAIMPLGIASAFPSTLIMAYAMVWLLVKKEDYIWRVPQKINRRFNIKKITSHSLSHS